MTLQEAIKEAQEKDIWLRPVCWTWTGYAYCIHGDILCIVPSVRGAQRALCPRVDIVLGEWETVHPDYVNKEYHAHTETP